MLFANGRKLNIYFVPERRSLISDTEIIYISLLLVLREFNYRPTKAARITGELEKKFVLLLEIRRLLPYEASCLEKFVPQTLANFERECILRANVKADAYQNLPHGHE